MLVWYLVLLIGLAHISWAQEDCDPLTACPSDDVAILPTNNQNANEHYYIGSMFSVHNEGTTPYECGNIRTRSFVNMEAFFWAIRKYQASAGLGNQVSVGGFAMDSCGRKERTVENVYSFDTCRSYYTGISPRNTVAFVGPDRSGSAIEAAALMHDLRRTQVSAAATSPMLSSDDYGFFLRTVPSDAVETLVMAKLLNFKGIKYVQVLYEDTEYGMGLFEAFQENAKAQDVCVTQSSMIDDNVAAFLKRSFDTKIVIVLADNSHARKVLEQVNIDSAIQNRMVFVGTSSWGKNTDVIQGLTAENSITVMLNTESYENLADVDEFWNYFYSLKPGSSTTTSRNNPWFNQFWEEMFDCRIDLNTCDIPNQNLRTKVPKGDTYIPFTLMAIDSIIRGVRDAATKYCGNVRPCSDLLNIDRDTLRSTDANQNRFFQNNGEAAPFYQRYKIVRIANGTYQDYTFPVNSGCNEDPCRVCGETLDTTVAPLSSSTTPMPDSINYLAHKDAFYKALYGEIMSDFREPILTKAFKMNQEITGVWGRSEMQERLPGEDKTRFEIGQDWIIALGVCAGLGIVCVLVFEIYILYKLMGTKMGNHWRTMWLGQLLLLGIFLSFLVCFAYLPTPNKATCGITRFGVGLAYSICFAVLLVKLMVLLTSKTTADTLLPGDVDSPNYLRGIYQFLMFMFIVGVQVVIGAMWLILIPPEAVKVTSNNGDMVWICNHYTWTLENEFGWSNMTTFVRTNFENHLISLTYIMFLILLTVVIAMKSHGIITNHRESVFIGISAGFSVPVWIAWGLVGSLNKDHQYAQEFSDACEAFGLLITAAIILFSMFLPKVRQLVNMGVEGIYLEDDRDTYYAGSVVMAPPSYKSRPSSVVYVNGNGYNEPVVLGESNAVHLKHPGSTYSAPVYVKRPGDSISRGSGKVLRMTGDLTGKHPRENRKSTSEAGYVYTGSGYGGTMRKSRSESGGGTLRRAHSTQDLGAL
ncbi:GRM2-like protein [Mya arenaria]|uniref:GRM2-like protein n=1 Tax=Mya arenaria TaxID=6604 RepID=A0ABY7E362_MYAAR|nr:GRM2-like protein [Mya arenaria]